MKSEKRPDWWMCLEPGDKVRINLRTPSNGKPGQLRHKNVAVTTIKAIRKTYINEVGSIWKVDDLGTGYINQKQLEREVKPTEDFLLTDNDILIKLPFITKITRLK